MALLRHLSFPTEQLLPLTTLLSLQIPQHLSKHTPTTLSLSPSLSSPSLFLPQTHSRSSSLRAKKLGNFVLQFSAAAQDQALDETPVLEAEPEEFSDTRLLAQNVPWHCTPQDVRTVFEKYGSVVDVELAMYDKTRNRGLAFVTMCSPEEARMALDNLESSEMEGRVIKMAYARPKKTKIPPPSSQPKPITFNMYVENLPYEARSKDLKVLFKSEDYNVVTAEIVFQNNREGPQDMDLWASKSRPRLRQLFLLPTGSCLWEDKFVWHVVNNLLKCQKQKVLGWVINVQN